jgi:predicted nucleic acid-binding protein
MKVVLDSNIFIADFLMQTPSFSILFESSKTKQIDLYIPQVVIDEVVNKYEQHLTRIFTELNSELKKYNKLSESSIILPIEAKNIEEKVKSYRINIEKKINENFGTILDYPNVEHKFLANKAMLNKKPFNSNEKGYRDNLIWENIKSIISDENPDAILSPDLVFISGNSKDFSGKENLLHEDLLKELTDKNKSEDVLIYESLGEFNEKVSKLYFAEATKFKEKIENKGFWDFDLKAIIEEYLLGEFIGSDLHNYREYTPYANDTPTIYLVNEDFEFQVTSVKQLTANEFLIDVEFELETTVTYFVDKSDYWSSEDDDYSVIDLEWNDHVVFVESDITLPISMSLIITSELECVGIEINKIDEDYDW